MSALPLLGTGFDHQRSRSSSSPRSPLTKAVAKNRNKPTPVTTANVAPKGREKLYAEMYAHKAAYASVWEGV